MFARSANGRRYERNSSPSVGVWVTIHHVGLLLLLATMARVLVVWGSMQMGMLIVVGWLVVRMLRLLVKC